MPDRTAVAQMVYLFDGSLPGLLCCIYESYTRREQVVQVIREEDGCFSLYPTRMVETDQSHAKRVYASLAKNLGSQGKLMVERAIMYGGDQDSRDTDIFRFISLGYRHGPSVCQMLDDLSVNHVYRMDRSVWNESHHLMGFVRFGECPEAGGLALPGSKNALAAVIQPKHNVLPLIAGHFCNRYPEENFLIFDKTYRQALVYHPYKAELIPMESFRLPAAVGEEELYRRLWKGYYHAISIAPRENQKLRMSLMPKRFWENITEVQDLI